MNPVPLEHVRGTKQSSIDHDSNTIIESDIPAPNRQREQTSKSVASIIGEFGLYQLSLTILAFFRYVCLAMMTNPGPLIAPDLEFQCNVSPKLERNLAKNDGEPIDSYLMNKCQLELKDGTPYECNSWNYDSRTTGLTMTENYNLVCDRDWLRSAFQSCISLGILVASVVLGSISDRHGRKFTITLCAIGSALSGIISCVAGNFTIYTISRMLCSFFDLGLVYSLTTIVIETLGTKYRRTICISIYTGWAFGIMVMPWIVEHYKNFQQLMWFTVGCHLFTLPWLMTVGESARWLLANGRIEEAYEELERINRWNCHNDKSFITEADEKFELLRGKFVARAERREQLASLNRSRNCSMSTFGGLAMANQLFSSKELAATTITVIWIGFNTELLYVLFILIESDVRHDSRLSYLVGGIMETLAPILSIAIMSKLPGKVSLSLTLTTISALCSVLAFTHNLLGASIWVLNLCKLAIATLSSIIYVVTAEMFPTNLRQTGFGACVAVGSLGAVIAPFIQKELADLIGITQVLLFIAILPTTAALVIPVNLRETRGGELPDDIDDFEGEESSSLQPRASSIAV